MDFSNIFVIIFLIGTALNFVLNQLLELIDYKARKKNGRIVPEMLKDYVDEQKLEQTCAYEDGKYFLWIFKNIVYTALSLGLWISGYYTFIFNWVWNGTGNVYLTALLFSLFASVPGEIVGLPFELYREFVLEKKFGFSQMTFKLWLIDSVKSLFVSLLLAVPLLLIMIALLLNASWWWWILLGGIYVVFSLGISVIYPIFIAPLFNKFTPVEEPELKNRIEALLEKTGFKANGIYMMDASKRSKHSNAYFTGMGKSKRIVLYDTLVQQLTVDEIESVLGHELGHYKKKHIVKRLSLSIPLIFAVLFIVSILIAVPELYTGFGFVPDVMILENGVERVLPYITFIGVLLVFTVFEGYSDFADLVTNAFSRKDEFEADRFAAELCGTGKNLESALIKLNKENLSEFTPPKIYSMFNYNHPPLLERLEQLKEFDKNITK